MEYELLSKTIKVSDAVDVPADAIAATVTFVGGSFAGDTGVYCVIWLQPKITQPTQPKPVSATVTRPNVGPMSVRVPQV